MCPILREPDGLAMSSRNIHLSEEERIEANILSKALFITREKFGSRSLAELKAEAIAVIENEPGVLLEYFEICNSSTLSAAGSDQEAGLVALVAAKVGETRLIDNIILK